MKDKKKNKVPENPRLTVRQRLLEIARIIRRSGCPDQAMEAAAWEKRIQQAIDEDSTDPIAEAA